MKLYHFPSPNPQKVTFALLELGLDCEKIPVDLTKGRSSRTGIPGRSIPQGGFGPRRRRRDADGVAGDPRLSRETASCLWPVSVAGRAQALQWLFFLSQHVMPAAGELALRIRSRVTGGPR